MADVSLILLAAGDSNRLNLPTKKQWLYIKDAPLWKFVAERFKNFYPFKKIIIVANQEELKLMQKFDENLCYVAGGKSRQASLKNALKEVSSKYVMVSDVARACITKKMVQSLIKKRAKKACVVPTIKVSDTLYFDHKPIDRQKALLIQTPQLSHTKTLKKILKKKEEFTDESSAFYSANKRVIFIEGSRDAHKITYQEDLKRLPCLKAAHKRIKSGFGIDIHAFKKNKQMFLGGVAIDAPFGFKAHSDGDVAIHAIIDALLGASSLGDIGELFPDNDPQYKGIDSKELLKKCAKLVRSVGYEIVHIDLTILAEIPKIAPYKSKIIQTLAKVLQLKQEQINIKATRGEKLGFVGRKEGVAVEAVATLQYYTWGEK